MTDWIQETIAARAETLGLTAYAVAQQCEPPLDPGTVKRYFEGRCRLNSEYVGRICDVLGLTVRPGKRVSQKPGLQPVQHIGESTKETT